MGDAVVKRGSVGGDLLVALAATEQTGGRHVLNAAAVAVQQSVFYSTPPPSSRAGGGGFKLAAAAAVLPHALSPRYRSFHVDGSFLLFLKSRIT